MKTIEIRLIEIKEENNEFLESIEIKLAFEITNNSYGTLFNLEIPCSKLKQGTDTLGSLLPLTIQVPGYFSDVEALKVGQTCKAEMSYSLDFIDVEKEEIKDIWFSIPEQKAINMRNLAEDVDFSAIVKFESSLPNVTVQWEDKSKRESYKTEKNNDFKLHIRAIALLSYLASQIDKSQEADVKSMEVLMSTFMGFAFKMDGDVEDIMEDDYFEKLKEELENNKNEALDEVMNFLT
jgi:hypothetical protein